MSNNFIKRCPSCGGNLTIDNEKQMYYCASCGSTYDYEYFREDNTHEMADNYLSRGEFLAASDAYKLVLKNDPHDFKALRGLMFVAANLKNMDELANVDTKGFSYDTELVLEVLKNASDEDKKYFTDWEQIYVDMKRKAECDADIISLEADKKSVEAKINIKKEGCNAYNFAGRGMRQDTPMTVFVRNWILSAFFLWAAGFNFFVFRDFQDVDKQNMSICLAIPFVIVTIVLIVINLAAVAPRVKAVSDLEKQIVKLEAKVFNIAAKRENLKEQSEELRNKISASCAELAKKDKSKI